MSKVTMDASVKAHLEEMGVKAKVGSFGDHTVRLGTSVEIDLLKLKAVKPPRYSFSSTQKLSDAAKMTLRCAKGGFEALAASSKSGVDYKQLLQLLCTAAENLKGKKWADDVSDFTELVDSLSDSSFAQVVKNICKDEFILVEAALMRETELARNLKDADEEGVEASLQEKMAAVLRAMKSAVMVRAQDMIDEGGKKPSKVVKQIRSAFDSLVKRENGVQSSIRDARVYDLTLKRDALFQADLEKNDSMSKEEKRWMVGEFQRCAPELEGDESETVLTEQSRKGMEMLLPRLALHRSVNAVLDKDLDSFLDLSGATPLLRDFCRVRLYDNLMETMSTDGAIDEDAVRDAVEKRAWRLSLESLKEDLFKTLTDELASAENKRHKDEERTRAYNRTAPILVDRFLEKEGASCQTLKDALYELSLMTGDIMKMCKRQASVEYSVMREISSPMSPFAQKVVTTGFKPKSKALETYLDVVRGLYSQAVAKRLLLKELAEEDSAQKGEPRPAAEREKGMVEACRAEIDKEFLAKGIFMKVEPAPVNAETKPEGQV